VSEFGGKYDEKKSSSVQMVTDFLGAWRRLTFGGRDHHTLWYDFGGDGI